MDEGRGGMTISGIAVVTGGEKYFKVINCAKSYLVSIRFSFKTHALFQNHTFANFLFFKYSST